MGNKKEDDSEHVDPDQSQSDESNQPTILFPLSVGAVREGTKLIEGSASPGQLGKQILLYMRHNIKDRVFQKSLASLTEIRTSFSAMMKGEFEVDYRDVVAYHTGVVISHAAIRNQASIIGRPMPSLAPSIPSDYLAEAFHLEASDIRDKVWEPGDALVAMAELPDIPTKLERFQIDEPFLGTVAARFIGNSTNIMHGIMDTYAQYRANAKLQPSTAQVGNPR